MASVVPKLLQPICNKKRTRHDSQHVLSLNASKSSTRLYLLNQLLLGVEVSNLHNQRTCRIDIQRERTLGLWPDSRSQLLA